MKMGGTISRKLSTTISLIGLGVILTIWYLVTEYGSIPSTILPKPLNVLLSFGELYTNYNVFSEAWYSIKLNFYGYIEAIAISLPLGFFIGLFPLPKALLSSWVDSSRFLPLTALMGLFVAWFGIELDMKVHFLAFGIIIYILPIMVKRISDVDNSHLQTAWTIGASDFQKFRYVYFPSVMSKLFSDIKVIVAVSWSYIVVAEMMNAEGGVGSLIFRVTKQGKTEMVFAILIIIVAIGIVNDIIFSVLNWLLYPFTYEYSQLKSKSGWRLVVYKIKVFFIYIYSHIKDFAHKYLIKPKEETTKQE